MKDQQKRATFEDVGNAQTKILEILDTVIDKNRVLTKEERTEFIKNMRVATLGLGTENRFIIRGKEKSYDLKHVAHTCYWLAYQEQKDIQMSKTETIEIKEFWKILRDNLFQIFPYADFTSIKISKEQTHLGISKAGQV